MKQDVNTYVNNCHQCMVKPPVNYATCYQVNIAPKWSQYIIDYLTMRVFPEGMSRTRMRAIETEAREYSLIGNQLYKRCADNELRMCATEVEYIPLLEQAREWGRWSFLSGKNSNDHTNCRDMVANLVK